MLLRNKKNGELCPVYCKIVWSYFRDTPDPHLYLIDGGSGAGSAKHGQGVVYLAPGFDINRPDLGAKFTWVSTVHSPYEVRDPEDNEEALQLLPKFEEV